ncbi:MAG: hypothetical protein JNJ49_13240 [Bdellovibrionaceae bacterium]|nr:hypothetical protein [Pseudobdellovibrionaceae bacterium]
MDQRAADRLVEEWLNSAKWAASGGNQQLWHVAVRMADSGFEFHVSIPTRDVKRSTADTMGAGAVASLGCFVTCLEEVGRSLNYVVDSIRVISGSDLWSTAIRLYFKPSSLACATIDVATIRARRTNRFPYKDQRVPDFVIKKIRQVLLPELDLIDLTASSDKVIRFVEDMTLLRMGNKVLFSDLLDEVFWRGEEPNRSTGLPEDTLGLSRLLRMALRFTKRHPFFIHSRLVHGLSLYQSVRRPLRRSSHIFFLGLKAAVPSELSPAEGWVNVGRAFQRIWLILEQNGVSLQPFAANLILVNHFADCERTILGRSDIQRVQKSRDRLQFDLGIDGISPGIFFRIGYPLVSVAGSPRKDLKAEQSQRSTDDRADAIQRHQNC